MLMMSLILVGALVVPSLGDETGLAAESEEPEPAGAESEPAAMSDAQAREWVALIDEERWGESWDRASDTFRSQISRADWASSVASVREPMGALEARELRTVSRVTEIPGVSAGDYEVLQFQTDFKNRQEAIEIVILSHEGLVWKVVGYFIR
jgi:hypothetical protein